MKSSEHRNDNITADYYREGSSSSESSPKKNNNNNSNSYRSHADLSRESFDSPPRARVSDTMSSILKPVQFSHLLPAFKKRPLSDTPMISKNGSPVLSTSDFSSTIDAISLSQSQSSLERSVSPLSFRKSSLSPKKDINLESAITDDENENENVATTEKSHSFQVLPLSQHERHVHRPKRRATTLDVPGLTKSRDSPDGTIGSLDVASKLVIIMVGLPARGKSYITNKLGRYLNWMHHECKVFNVGNTRRKTGPCNKGPFPGPLLEKSQTSHSASFFSPENVQTRELREKWAMDTLDELLDYVLNKAGSVGIFDATNTTRLRRKKIVERINEASDNQLKILFLESICDDPRLIQQNIRLKLSGPDYKDMDKDLALKDFTERLRNYEQAYETIDERKEKKVFKRDIQYVKMINTGKKIISYNIQGFLASQTIYFLLNFNLNDRLIMLTRHGESADNVAGRIGGDCDLTERGYKFAKALAKFVTQKRQEFHQRKQEELKNKFEIEYDKNSRFESDNESESEDEDGDSAELTFGVWTSSMKRSINTAKYFNSDDYFVKEMRMLNELGAGKMEGMTYKEIQDKYPLDFKLRINDKLTYRYPGLGGESYLDVINRLKPIIGEIERAEDHLLLITHRVVSRILLAYFLNISKKHIGDLDIPLHSIYILEPKPYGVDWSLYEYDEDQDTFFKVDKFKYTKRLKEVSLSNAGRRKYSVVPSVPKSELFPEPKDVLPEARGPMAKALDSRGTDNLQRLREFSHDSSSIDLINAVSSVRLEGIKKGEASGIEIDKLKERLNGLQKSMEVGSGDGGSDNGIGDMSEVNTTTKSSS